MRASAGTPAPPGGAFTGTNSRYNLLSNGIPFISVSTGSMGNNGALTAITALDTTYSDGVWMLFPAGAVAAGVPAAAAWLWVVMSSTTAGTVFNSTYVSGQVSPGAATAFVTTGPGAFTGVTGANNAIVVSVPAGSLGTQGFLAYDYQADCNSNANGKNISAVFGATTYNTFALASALSGRFCGVIQNRGLATRQVGNNILTTGGFGSSNAVQTQRGTDNTATALNFVISLNKATATDNLILSSLMVDAVFRA